MGNEAIPAQPPFVADDNGYPTEESVRAALQVCRIDVLADLDAVYADKRDKLVPLIAQNCLVEHLSRNWPKGFIGAAMGAVQEAQRT
jgi:hypothetical protein